MDKILWDRVPGADENPPVLHFVLVREDLQNLSLKLQGRRTRKRTWTHFKILKEIYINHGPQHFGVEETYRPMI